VPTWKANKFIELSEKEYEKYKKTGEAEYLAQAGEKLWNAFKIWLKERTKKDIKKHAEVEDRIKDIYKKEGYDEKLWEIYYRLYKLHLFFYTGEISSLDEAEAHYKNALRLLERAIKEYR